MRKFLMILFVLGLSLCAIGYGGLRFLEAWQQTSIEVPSETLIELRPRMTLAQLSDQLHRSGLISSPILFQLWMRLTGGYGQFQAGTYQFVGSINPTIIKDKMIQGDIFVPSVLQVIIPEGFTIRMLNDRLATKGVGQIPELAKLVHDREFLKELHVDSSTLEGYTYPATYKFTKLPTPKEFYRTVVGKFFERLPSGYTEDVKKMGLTLGQAVTFASLIELETMQEAEKPMIAEVIWRRLKRGDALGIDAAIIYGIANYKGDITWAHLKDAKNPYNTRIHRGLPPTPIGAVTESSLQAVLHPTDLGYYYYMLDANDRTRHVFTRTAEEHNIQVQRFLRAQKSTELGRSPPKK